MTQSHAMYEELVYWDDDGTGKGQWSVNGSHIDVIEIERGYANGNTPGEIHAALSQDPKADIPDYGYVEEVFNRLENEGVADFLAYADIKYRKPGPKNYGKDFVVGTDILFFCLQDMIDEGHSVEVILEQLARLHSRLPDPELIWSFKWRRDSFCRMHKIGRFEYLRHEVD